VLLCAAGSSEAESEIRALVEQCSDWHRVLRVAQRNRVLALLSRRLVADQGVPAEIRAALAVAGQTVRRESRATRARFERALPAIVEHHRVALLRGIAYLYTIDGGEARRSIGEDVDLLIDRPGGMSLSGWLLLLIDRPGGMSLSGWLLDHHRVSADVRQLWTDEPPTLEYHHEFNFKTSWCVRLARIPMAELWQRCRTLSIAGCEVSLLDPEDEFVYLCYHNVLKGFVKLYRFIDLIRLARARPLDWSRVVDRARRWRVDRAVWANLRLIGVLAPGLVPAEVIDSVAPGRTLRRWVRRLEGLDLILHDPRHTPGPTAERWRRRVRKGLLFRLLLVRPGNLAKILVGPVNLVLFRSASTLMRQPLVHEPLLRMRARIERA